MTKYCSKHPNAPHGFNRSASHSADRYVCDCESWEEPIVNKSLIVQKPLSGMKILELAEEYRLNVVLSDAINFARAIEKAHGIG